VPPKKIRNVCDLFAPTTTTEVMFRALSHRPLAVAGFSVLLGTAYGLRFGSPSGIAFTLSMALGLALAGVAVICVKQFAPQLRAGHATAAAWSLSDAIPRGPLLLTCAAMTAGIYTGGTVFAASHHAEAVRRQWSARDPPQSLVSAVLLVQTADENPWTGRAWIIGARADGTRLHCSWPGRVPSHIGVGTRVRATGRLNLPRAPTNPGQRDSPAAWARDGVAGRLYVKSPKNIELLSGSPAAWRILLRRVRRTAAKRLRRDLPAQDAGVACALLLGWRTGLSAEDRLRFERTGTMHLLAISGMHLLLVAGLAHALARRMGAGARAAAACALVFALLYVPIAGAGAPVRRAAIVLTTHAVALARGRIPDPASSLGGALVVLLLLDPVELYRLGFWLSFLAAIAIAALAQRWSATWSERTRLLARFPAVQRDRAVRLRLTRYFWSGLAVSLAAGCATQPLIAYHFRIVTPLSPFTNLLAAPFVTLLMPLVAAHAAGIEAAAPVISATLAAMRVVLDLCASIPGASLAVSQPDRVAMGIWMVGVVLMIRRPRTGAALLAIALSLAWPTPRPVPPSFLLLDVGHGQAALLRDRDGRTVLIDAGSRDRPGVGRRVVLPALREAGIAELDCCVCTHDDADHWRGMLPLFGRIRIRELVVGESVPPLLVAQARKHGVPVRQAVSGTTLWRGNGASLVTLADGRGRNGANNQSLVLLAEIGRHRLLLPADRETDGVRALLKYDVPHCAVLVAPHHGAALRPHSLARSLGQTVQAAWVLASNGRRSADPESLSAFGPRQWSTYLHGALHLVVRQDGSLQLRPTRGRGATIAPQ